MDDQNNQESFVPQPAVNPQPRQQPYQQAPAQQFQQPPAASYDDGMFGRRMGRLAYFVGGIYLVLPLVLVALLQLVIHFVLNTTSGNSSGGSSAAVAIISILIGLVCVVFFLPLTISMAIRRLHDLNHPGIFVLFSFVPFINGLFGLYLLFFPGTEGVNQYGPRVDSLNPGVVLGFKKP